MRKPNALDLSIIPQLVPNIAAELKAVYPLPDWTDAGAVAAWLAAQSGPLGEIIATVSKASMPANRTVRPLLLSQTVQSLTESGDHHEYRLGAAIENAAERAHVDPADLLAVIHLAATLNRCAIQ